jgi:hypothetical protein
MALLEPHALAYLSGTGVIEGCQNFDRSNTEGFCLIEIPGLQN